MNNDQNESRKPVSEAIKRLHPSARKAGGAKKAMEGMGGSSVGKPGGAKKAIERMGRRTRRK